MPLTLLVYEHVTGGGMLADSPPAGLVHEADRMVRTLLAEVAALPLEVVTTRDPRLPPVPGARTVFATAGDGPFGAYRRALPLVDLAWPTAPESGGALASLGRLTLAAGRRLVGSAPEAVAIAGSKAATAERLAHAGVTVAATFRDPASLTPHPGPWVVKPDDGAGAEGVRRVAGWAEACRALEAGDGALVAQPWLEGEARSLSLLVTGAAVELLAINRQRMLPDGEGLRLAALEVNAVPDTGGRHARLAAAVARALPGLAGYVGVDFIATGTGPVVLEVNPRLTTSYCGLPAALGHNIAARILGMAQPAGLVPAPGRVELLDLEPGHVS